MVLFTYSVVDLFMSLNYTSPMDPMCVFVFRISGGCFQKILIFFWNQKVGNHHKLSCNYIFDVVFYV